MESYLKNSLNVPDDHIRNLRDSRATRSAIIQGFDDLLNDTRIKEGDPIFIYYAGHGGEAMAPPGWEAEGHKIQLIIPHDTHMESKGKIVAGIPDRTIAALLNKLSKIKGDNIVCKFSAYGGNNS